jgi:general secretion pathway protein K
MKVVGCTTGPGAGRLHISRGMALLLSLWALFLLSAMVISWALDIDAQLGVSTSASRVMEAEAMACSGAEVALFPTIKPSDSNLRKSIGHNRSYEAHITGEGGRLNINWLVAGEDPVRLEILRKYLESKGIDLNERDHMMDCLLDWVDPDNLVRLNGAEDEGDYHPANSLLTRIDQMKKIKGWEAFTSQPGWDDDLTLNSSGPIDLSWASRDVLLALPGMNEQLVDSFLQLRRGPDGIDGTDDDLIITSVDQIRGLLGLTPDQFAQLNGLIGFKDPVFRIVSVGKSGDTTRTVQMVVRKVGNAPQMITWKEL